MPERVAAWKYYCQPERMHMCSYYNRKHNKRYYAVYIFMEQRCNYADSYRPVRRNVYRDGYGCKLMHSCSTFFNCRGIGRYDEYNKCNLSRNQQRYSYCICRWRNTALFFCLEHIASPDLTSCKQPAAGTLES